MMIKYRVHEVAKDFGLPNNKEIIELLQKEFGETKKHMTALTEEELDIVFEYYTQTNEVENFDAYFALGEEARKEREAAKEAEKAAKLAEQQAIADQLMQAARQAAADTRNSRLMTKQLPSLLKQKLSRSRQSKRKK